MRLSPPPRKHDAVWFPVSRAAGGNKVACAFDVTQ